jgi:hypothetical protein
MALMFRPPTTTGLVAILDALGAAAYSEIEIEQFLKSRQTVLDLLNQKLEGVTGRISTDRLKIFTFNDTIVIVFLTAASATLSDVEAFCKLLRKFMIDSFRHRILFRGSISAGAFYGVDDESNTVMGPAISDAASWYERADWIGIHATPHATIIIDALLEGSGQDIEHVMIDYDVPLRDQRVRLKAVNWPKGFWVKGVKPEGPQKGRAALLSFLSQHPVPVGTESKYRHALDFFDHVVRTHQLDQPKVK